MHAVTQMDKQEVQQLAAVDDAHLLAIIARHQDYWKAIYQQQIELKEIEGMGPGAEQRIERDIGRCAAVLSEIGADIGVGGDLEGPMIAIGDTGPDENVQ